MKRPGHGPHIIFGDKTEPIGGYAQPVETPRWWRIVIGALLLFGALLFGLLTLLLIWGIASSTSSFHPFHSFVALMAVVFAVTGFRLVRMKGGDHLYTAEGSMVGGILTFSIGVFYAIWSYWHDVADFAWTASLPIVVGMFLYWAGRRRMIARLSPHDEQEL